MDPSIEAIEFVARSAHRVGVLDALREGASTRDELREGTGASSPTIGRVLAALTERRWIERDGTTYRLTPLGAYVANHFFELRDAMETERRLRDVWQWLPREMANFSVDLFADAVVSYPGPNYPYEPVERITTLIDESSQMSGFGTTVFKSINNETLCRNVIEGMEYEYVYSPPILEATVAWDPERVAAAAACENCTIFVHDDLPDEQRCGIGIFDDRMGICCHDAETGMLRAVVDTEAPEARQWALSVYEAHRETARPLDAQEKASLFPPEVLA